MLHNCSVYFSHPTLRTYKKTLPNFRSNYVNGIHTNENFTLLWLLQSLYNVPETKVTTLSNGLKVATEDSGLSTATVCITGLSNDYYRTTIHCSYGPATKNRMDGCNNTRVTFA